MRLSEDTDKAVQQVAGYHGAAVLQLLPCMAQFLMISGIGWTLSRGEQWLGEGLRLLSLFWLYPVELLGWRRGARGEALSPQGWLELADLEEVA